MRAAISKNLAKVRLGRWALEKTFQCRYLCIRKARHTQNKRTERKYVLPFELNEQFCSNCSCAVGFKATGSMKEWSSVDNGSVKLENMDVRGDGTSFMHSMTMLIARILCSILMSVVKILAGQRYSGKERASRTTACRYNIMPWKKCRQ